MGYREFAKDYKIEFVDRPGHKRPKAVRVYVGPWYRFKEPPEKIRFLRWFYLIGLSAVLLFLLIPMCIDCAFTRIWYIQVPAVAAWIPWIFGACATWRLWTAKEQVDREHKEMLCERMSGSCLFLMIFFLISFLGGAYASIVNSVETADYLICFCYLLCEGCAVALFSQRKMLEMVRIES